MKKKLPERVCSKCNGTGKNIVPESAPEFFRRWRESKALTQVDLMKLTGISNGHISQFERGELVFSEKRLRRLARVLEK